MKYLQWNCGNMVDASGIPRGRTIVTAYVWAPDCNTIHILRSPSHYPQCRCRCMGKQTDSAVSPDALCAHRACRLIGHWTLAQALMEKTKETYI